MDIPMMNEINENTNAAAEVTQDAIEVAKAAILAAMPSGGAVKSIQYQQITDSTKSGTSYTFTISAVDPTKSIVICNSGIGCYLKAFTATKVTMDFGGNAYYKHSIQVVEFY